MRGDVARAASPVAERIGAGGETAGAAGRVVGEDSLPLARAFMGGADLAIPTVAERMGEDNNAPWPGPREGEFETSSGLDVLSGVDSQHMHGILGLGDDGKPLFTPTPLPKGGLTDEELTEAHKGFCFNSRKSDALPLDRPQPDQRSQTCRAKHSHYPRKLPPATVVIVFHNENLAALLRSVHSVLNLSPAELLEELILVDDASVVDEGRFSQAHWERLQGELNEYCKRLPKTRLVRLKERRGLMLARMEGVWRVRSAITVFLDSHIEATVGWLEPLLARIAEDRRHVVVPSIDTIGYESFEYSQGGGLGAMSFSWSLGQRPFSADTGPDGTQPAKSPVMCGGLFATDTRMFLELGGYDPEMKLYGGEEMEIGFRTWMCGSDIEFVPCSHVGHIFRSAKYWHGQVYRVPGEEIARNKLRTAEVWMDDHKALVQYAQPPLKPPYSLGDVGPRMKLREKLHCHNFEWYLKNVAPNVFAPKLSVSSRSGALQNRQQSICLDTLGNKGQSRDPMGAYGCHGQHGTQSLVMDDHGLVRLPDTDYKYCMSGESGDAPVISLCDENRPEQLWRHDSSQKFVSMSQNKCLKFLHESTAKSPYKLVMVACQEGDPALQWFWS